MFIMLYYLAELVSAEKELSDWFPERSDFFLYGKDLTKSNRGLEKFYKRGQFTMKS